MRVVDRLYQFLEFKGITPYAFEHTCGVSNGYLNKQYKGKGSIGSDILEKVVEQYRELSLIWLLTGNGAMIQLPEGRKRISAGQELQEDENTYTTSIQEIITLLKDKVAILEAAIADKDTIIALLETSMEKENRKKAKEKKV